jgi:hypothetical protein
MCYLILSCASAIPRTTCEDRVRALLAPFGEVGRIIVVERASNSVPWVAAAEMRSGKSAALEALKGASIDGEPLRIRPARPIDLAGLFAPS